MVAANQRIERAIERCLSQIARELVQQGGFLGARGRNFFRRTAGDLFAHLRETKTALMQELGSVAFFFAENAEQQVLGSDVFVIEAFSLLGAIGEHPLALMAKG